MQTACTDARWSDEQVQRLRQFAARHGLALQLDITDDGETAFADFLPDEHGERRMTLLHADAAFVVNDEEGYALLKTPLLEHALDLLAEALAESCAPVQR